MNVELAPVVLPEFGLPSEDVVIPAATYADRLSRFQAEFVARGFDLALVYGDREHFANLAYLTAYDPRFEEALLVLRPGRKPRLLVGNEGMAYATASVPVGIDFVLYQPFSLLSQPRGEGPTLEGALSAAGVEARMRIASVGWKYFVGHEKAESALWLEIPTFITDVLRRMGCAVENATDILMEPGRGMRAANDVDQLAAFEAAASFSSQAVRDIVFGLRPGMSEYEGIQLARLNGWPISMYPILLGGERTRIGLGSPSHARLKRGERVVTCIGLWGGNTCRAGFLAEGPGELPADVSDYVEKLVVPYYRSAVAWYESLGLGVSGGQVYEAVHLHVGAPFFGVKLNPGHLIHLDEWVSSPISRNSSTKLHSGMALQLDIIPSNDTYWTSNIEDGVALADEELRAALSRRYPSAWDRIQRRREFMRIALGIRLRPEVLPFSNLAAYLPPFWLSPGMAMRVRPPARR